MPRSYCPKCAYPKQSCLCGSIRQCCYQTHLIVLQHPSETTHAKNTARLISLVSPETETIVGETPEDFSEVSGRLQADPNAVVLFPSAISVPLATSAEQAPIETIVIIDGTWRKAKKIWLSNPWLQSMRNCHLNEAQSSSYRIRSSSVPDGMASIESAASALSELGEKNTDALIDAFMAMQAMWPVSNKHPL